MIKLSCFSSFHRHTLNLALNLLCMSVILKNPKIALVLIVIGLPVFTGCLSTQSENMNPLPGGFALKIIPLAIGNPFFSGLVSGYTGNSKTFKARNSRQPVQQR